MRKFLKWTILTLLVAGVLPVSVFAARTNDLWLYPSGAAYIQTNFPAGLDLLIVGSNHYINFGTVSGTSGYGIRDNGGNIECKNSGGSWSACQDGTSGGGGAWPFTTSASYNNQVTQSTSTLLWLRGSALSLAASTSVLTYASTTQVSATSLCLTGDVCRTTWPTSGTGAWPFVSDIYNGSLAQSTTTPLWLKNTMVIASTTFFTSASSTNETVSGTLWAPAIVQSSPAFNSFTQINPTDSAIVGNLVQSGGVTLLSASLTLTANQFCGTGLVVISSSSPAAVQITIPSLAAIQGNGTCGASAWTSSFAQQFLVNNSNFPVTEAATDTAITFKFAPGTPTSLPPGGIWFITGQLANDYQKQGFNASGNKLNVNVISFGTNSSTTVLSLSNGFATSTLTAAATSTLATGVNIATGCFAVNNVCMGNGSSAWPFNSDIYNGVLAQSTTTPIWLKNTMVIASTTFFTQASTTQLSVAGLSWHTALATFGAASTTDLTTSNSLHFSQLAGNGLLMVNLDKKVIQAPATSSPAFYANGGTNGTVLGQTNGVVGWVATSSAAGGSGTVTQVNTDSTLVGGPLTTTGTLGLNLTNANRWDNFINIGASTGWYMLGSSTLAYASTTNQVTVFGLGAGGNSATTTLTNVHVTAVGWQALSLQTTGDGNTAFGNNALNLASTSPSNTAVGYGALWGSGSNTFSATGQNTAIGYWALASSTSGNNNTAVGFTSGRLLTSGISETLIGSRIGVGVAMTGNSNTVVGDNSGKITSGAQNTLVGQTVATAGTVTGNNNAALGYNSLRTITSAAQNSGLGASSLNSLTTGPNNTALGYQTGFNLTTGYDNIIIGETQNTGGNNLTTGGGNILIGYNPLTDAVNSTLKLNIGGILFGSLPATSTQTNLQLPITGGIGVATTTPWGLLALSANNGAVYPSGALFVISSSTASATSTLFFVDNMGTVGVGTSTPTAALTVSNIVRGAGALLLAAWTNVTNAFTITNATGATVFNVDTTNTTGAKFGIGTSTPVADLTVQLNFGDTNSTAFLIASTTGVATTTLFKIDRFGDMYTNTPGVGDTARKPTVGSDCGTNVISATSTDMRGLIIVSAGTPSTCTLIFAKPKDDSPTCVVSTNSLTLLGDIAEASSTGVRFGLSAVFTGNIRYICLL